MEKRFELRVTVRTAKNGATLADVLLSEPGQVRLHRITISAGQDHEALHQQLHAVVLAALKREAGPAGRVVGLERMREGK